MYGGGVRGKCSERSDQPMPFTAHRPLSYFDRVVFLILFVFLQQDKSFIPTNLLSLWCIVTRLGYL